MGLPLTVATFNIRNGHAPDGRDHWFLRRSVTARWARELSADVIGFQEAYRFQRTYLARHLPEDAVAGIGRNADGGGEGVPVFVRRPLAIVDIRHRWFSATPDIAGSTYPGAGIPRMATIVTCEHPESGARFVVANVHLDHKNEANRRAAVRQIIGDLDSDLPVLIMGDLNADPLHSKLFADLDAAGYRRLPYDGATFQGFKHVRTSSEGQIDHLLFRDGATGAWTLPQAAEVVWSSTGRLPSDHWPVVARVELDARLDPPAEGAESSDLG